MMHTSDSVGIPLLKSMSLQMLIWPEIIPGLHDQSKLLNTNPERICHMNYHSDLHRGKNQFREAGCYMNQYFLALSPTKDAL